MIRFIIWLINGFLSTFSFIYLYGKATKAKNLSKYCLAFYLFGVISATLIEFYQIEVLSYVSYFLFFPFMFKLVNNYKLKKRFFYLMMIWLTAIIVDIFSILVTSLIFYLFNINFTIYVNNSEYVSMFLTFCVSVILIILTKLGIFNERFELIYLKIKDIKYSDILLIIFALFIFFIGITMFLNIENIDINVLSMLVLIFAILCFLLLIRYKINEVESKLYLNTLKENNEFYIKMEDENRIFKHNLVAKLLGIKSVSNEKSTLLIEDLIQQFNKSIDFSKKMKVIPYGLNGIIYQKLYTYMKDLNIEISNELYYDIFEVLKPRRYNVFVEKLVIALDNAIESCLNSDSKSLVINIYDDNSSVCIEIENTFGNNIDLDLLGNKNYSTKGFKHGLGLFSAFRNSEAVMNVKIVNNIFVSKITAKKHHID